MPATTRATSPDGARSTTASTWIQTSVPSGRVALASAPRTDWRLFNATVTVHRVPVRGLAIPTDEAFATHPQKRDGGIVGLDHLTPGVVHDERCREFVPARARSHQCQIIDSPALSLLIKS